MQSFSAWMSHIETLAGRNVWSEHVEYCDTYNEYGDVDGTHEFGVFAPVAATRLADILDRLIPQLYDGTPQVSEFDGEVRLMPMRSWTQRFIDGLRRAARADERLEFSG